MTTAPAMPAFATTVNAVVIRSSVWLGIRRIINDFRTPKNKCGNRSKTLDATTISGYRLCVMNKYQIKANKEKLARIQSGELTRIADRAIAAAKAVMVKGSHTIDASDMTQSANPLERHIGSQMDGYTISAKISAKVELDSAAREIVKLGTIDKQIAPEAMSEWNRIEAVAAELGLNEEEVA